MMKKIQIFLWFVLASLLSIIVVFRLPIGKSIIEKKEYASRSVKDRFGKGIMLIPNKLRCKDRFERIFGNQTVYFWKNKKLYFSGVDYEDYYFSEKDTELLWKEYKKIEENDSLEVTFEVKKLLFGGFGVAKIIRIDIIKAKPEIRK